MSAMDKRLAKLEQLRGGTADRLFVFIVPIEPGPNGPIEHEPIGLSPMSRSGPLFPRLPGESVEDMQARAVRGRPDVTVWVTRYEQDATPANATPITTNSPNLGTVQRYQFRDHLKGTSQ